MIGGVVVLGLDGSKTGGEGVVQFLVLLHRAFAVFNRLVVGFLLLLGHAAFLLFAEHGRGAGGRGGGRLRGFGGALLRDLLQVEVDRSGVAQAGTDAVHAVHFLAVHFDGDVIGAERQAVVEVVTLLVRIALVVALDVRARDLDHRVDLGSAVFAFYVAFDRRNLGERGQGQKQSPGRGNNQVAKLHKTSKN